MRHVFRSLVPAALAAFALVGLLVLAGCGGSGTTYGSGSHDLVSMTLGSQTILLPHVQEAFDSASQTTSITADNLQGRVGSPGTHEMTLTFPSAAKTGTWTQAQGCRLSMNNGSGMMDASDVTVTVTNYPTVGGDITGTFGGTWGGQTVNGSFIVRRTM